ncbi:hypothetical protein PYCCODRAFT_1437675 [Trametes coccinea BRFM310]|uniref:Mucoidy inhibitor A n=1 Tax=Trametes coccinea (strain BRFM310) TaxID=1353009 RepID=A0A1Y2IG45_TRAC3|nr:hypothetical protein PYCCODRAFT_1437675 [Trametes coccinea BRFM310]
MTSDVINFAASAAPVVSATIFPPSKAQLTRLLATDLKNGCNTVQISGIEGLVDADSVTIAADRDAGPPGIRVLETVYRGKREWFEVDEDDAGNATAYNAEIQDLESKLDELNAEREVLNTELALVDHARRLALGSSTPGLGTAGLSAESAQVSPARALLDFADEFVQRKLTTRRAIKSLDEKVAAIARQLTALRKARERRGTPAVVSATIIAQRDFQTTLRLTYTVQCDISWKPSYELHTHTSSDGSLSANVSLGYNAIVSQRTGEDWRGVNLYLKTAQSQQSVAALLDATLRHSLLDSKIVACTSSIHNVDRGSRRTSQRPIRRQGSTQGETHSLNPPRPLNSDLAPSSPVRRVWATVATPTDSMAPLLAFADSSHPSAFANRDPAVSIAPSSFARFLPHAATRESSSPGGRERHHSLGRDTPEPGGERLILTSRTAEGASTRLHDEVDAVRPSDTELPPSTPLLPPSTVRHGMFGSTIHLSTPISLPGNGEAHKFTIATLGLEGRYRYFCVPRESLDVQVLAEFKNKSEYDLLPGPVNVLVDDELAFKSHIGPDRVKRNGTFTCSLGIEQRLEVSYAHTKSTSHEPRTDSNQEQAEATKETTHAVRISIHNRALFDVTELTVRDVVSIADAGGPLFVRAPRRRLVFKLLGESEPGRNEPDLEDSAKGKARAKAYWAKIPREDAIDGEMNWVFEWVFAVPAQKGVNFEATWVARDLGEGEMQLVSQTVDCEQLPEL